MFPVIQFDENTDCPEDNGGLGNARTLPEPFTLGETKEACHQGEGHSCWTPSQKKISPSRQISDTVLFSP